VIRLGYSNVDAEGLKALSALKQVEQLALEACAMVNDEAASELSNFKSLRYVDLQETKVTEKGAAALRKSKPGITILGPATAVKNSASERVEPGR
jgi:hypothetical protein